HFGGIAEIGDETEAAITGMKSIADRLGGIVWDGKILDQNIADSEFGTGAKESPVFVLAQPEATNGLGRLCVAINWKGKLPGMHSYSQMETAKPKMEWWSTGVLIFLHPSNTSILHSGSHVLASPILAQCRMMRANGIGMNSFAFSCSS